VSGGLRDGQQKGGYPYRGLQALEEGKEEQDRGEIYRQTAIDTYCNV